MDTRRATPPHECQPRFCADCDRFGAWYRLAGDEREALAKAEDLCIEQTVEFPYDLLPSGFIRDHVVGRIDHLEKGADGAWRVLVTFANDDTGLELTQLLNVLYGNVSLKPGIRLESLKD
jgi:ribulose-bisphosphate carboxylase large chain